MDEQREANLKFSAEWNKVLLQNIEKYPEDNGVALMHRCAEYHYNLNNMDQILKPFIGNLEGFLEFLKNHWGWIITYDNKTHIITADENKDDCVCPIVHSTDKKSMPTLLCHCSEGFGKLMFSKIIGKDVQTEVVRSVLRGDKSCVYKIWF